LDLGVPTGRAQHGLPPVLLRYSIRQRAVVSTSPWLTDRADDAPFEFPQGGELVEPHLSLAFGTNKRGCFINFSDEVGPAFS
jgi:hypothetical protein